MKRAFIFLVYLACITLAKADDFDDSGNEKEEIHLKFEIQNDQQQQENEPQSEEQFVAVHVNQMNVNVLNPSLPIIEDIVVPFISNQYEFLYATNATREIVNGFKYEITFVMRNIESDSEIHCVMDVIEKPWLINKSQKFRKMTYNNCSLANPMDEDDRMRFQYEINPTFTNQRTEMSEEDVRIMEDQIVTETSSTPLTATVSTEDVSISPLDPSSKNILDDFFNTNNFFPQPQITSTTTTTTTTTTEKTATGNRLSTFNMDVLDEMFGVRKVENSQSQPHQHESSSSSENADELQQRTHEGSTEKNDKEYTEFETEIKKAFSELFQTNPEFRMSIIALINRNDDTMAEKNYNYVVNVLAGKLKDKIELYKSRRTSSNFGDQQVTVDPNEQISRKRKRSIENVPHFPLAGGISPHRNPDELQIYVKEAIDEINGNEDPDYSFVKIVSATSQVVAGIRYRIKAVLNSNGNEVSCDFDVVEQAWIKDGRSVTVKCDNQKLYSLVQTPVNQRTKRQTLVGAPEKINDHTDVTDLLSQHLHRFATGSNKGLELIKIESVSRQVVAGLKYIVKGKFKVGDEEKTCEIDIWHQAWIKGDDGVKIQGDCSGETVKARSKRSIHHHKHESHRQLADHFNDHHHHHDRHHHYSATEQMKEVKSEILFDNFVKKYNRKYANDQEHQARLRIFKRNLHKIEMLNKHEQGTAKYGITEFADLNEKEYLHKTGLRVPQRHENDLGNPTAHVPDVDDLPTEFDWREKGVVTDVKNQGNCGSCWSFSVTGNIEGLHAIKTGKLEAYSEQELLDCDTTDNACNGGYMDDAFKAIEKIGGLELEDEYPYRAKKQKKCLFNATMSHVKVKGVVDLPKGDELAMQKFLVSTGPISIGINANAMQFYRGGVSHPWKVLCRKSNLDHGVLIVGYGIKEYPLFNKTLPYWTVKNSWGPKWGEQGYYRVYRGDNSCGVAEMASSAVLE